MEIVIDIDDHEYTEIKEDAEIFRNKGMTVPHLYTVIESGTPLPKGHGRLVDENEVDNLRCKYFDFSDNEVNCIKRGVHRLKTVVEADKEKKEC